MRLTKQAIEALQAEAKVAIHWDDKIKGLGVRVTPSGVKSWVLDYRTSENVQRRQTLGRADVIHPDEARRQAREVLVAVARGGDPMAEIKVRLAEPTISDLYERFKEEHIGRKKPSTQSGYTSAWDAQLIPRLGKKKVRELDEGDVANFLLQLEATPYIANRSVRILSKAFNLATKRWRFWGWPKVEKNPCRGAELHPEEKVQRYLTPEELDRLMAALDTWPATPVQERFAKMIHLLLITGCRRGEWMGATWDQVDWANKALDVPDEKSKTGRKTVFLTDEAVAILRQLKAGSNHQWVIAGAGDGPIKGQKKLWASLMKHAAIENFRIHDLRHSFASFGVKAKLSLPQIGGLLGHKSAQTTARYAHLMEDDGRAAAAAVVGQILTKKKGPQ